MADLKISQLTGSTTPLIGTEVLPVVQSGVTKQVSVVNLTAGRLVKSGAFETSTPPVGSLGASKWFVQTEDTVATRAYACGPNITTFGTFELYLSKSTASPSLGLGLFATYSVLRAAGVSGLKVDLGSDVHAEAGNFTVDTANKALVFGGNGNILWRCGAGTPEGAVTASVGSIYTRTDGGANTTLYIKESGTGNTGWVAK